MGKGKTEVNGNLKVHKGEAGGKGEARGGSGRVVVAAEKGSAFKDILLLKMREGL